MSELDDAMTFAEVSEILRIVDGAPRGGELTVQLGGAALTLKLQGDAPAGAPAPAAISAAAPAPAAPAPSAPAAAAQALPAQPAPAAAPTEPNSASATSTGEVVDHTGLVEVSSPMTGVWYRTPMPGEPSFVEVGDTVAEGQQLGIIEVMKLMNRIVSPCPGTVREICVANEELVEYGVPLVWIEPSAG